MSSERDYDFEYELKVPDECDRAEFMNSLVELKQYLQDVGYAVEIEGRDLTAKKLSQDL
jgi:hypothetical protein